MISHIHLGTADLERAVAFYTPILDSLGWAPRFHDTEREWAGWEPKSGGRPLFIIGTPYDAGAASHGNGTMIALLAPDCGSVDRAYDIAIAGQGACEGKPGPRPEYHPGYYGAYVRDRDGNKICICCHNFAPNTSAPDRPVAATSR